MLKIAWFTDIHLEFLNSNQRTSFCKEMAETKPDVVLIGGDISTAPKFTTHLLMVEEQLECPIYFVLGNHDFYGGSITKMRQTAKKISDSSRQLHWLTNSGIVKLTENSALIGHGSWADGRLGNGPRSEVLLNDYFYIEEFLGLSEKARFAKLNQLGDEAAAYFKHFLPKACHRFKNLLLLTHVPPFRESCWHEGAISDNEFLPHFSCQAVGEVLLDVMQAYPQCHLTVLCGHTHSSGEAQILPNLYVKTGSAIYGSPYLQELIIVE
ncbi:MAG: metallophosphoesterase family protein [Ardenticatenaceae bacterium]